MSTEIATITGSKENNIKELRLTSFWAGKEKGRSIQFSLDFDYVSFQRDKIQKLVDILNRWLEE
jgi:hypothetical protein